MATCAECLSEVLRNECSICNGSGLIPDSCEKMRCRHCDVEAAQAIIDAPSKEFKHVEYSATEALEKVVEVAKLISHEVKRLLKQPRTTKAMEVMIETIVETELDPALDSLTDKENK